MNWPDRFAASRIWPWNRMKELRNLTPRQREDLWGQCSRKGGGVVGCLLAPVGLILGMIVSGTAGGYIIANTANPAAELIIGIGTLTLLGPVVGLVLALMLGWRVARGEVRRWLQQRAEDGQLQVCLGCGYDLRGLPDNHPECPECGHALHGHHAIPT